MARKISAHTTEAPGSTSDLIGNVGSTTKRFTAQQILSIPITAQGDILFGDSSADTTRLAAPTSGAILQYSSGSSAPAWVTVTSGGVLIGAVAGTPTFLAPPTSGAVLTFSSASSVPAWVAGTTGGILTGNAAGTPVFLGPPTSGAVLTYSSASSIPAWSIPTSGAVLVASSVGTPTWRAIGTSGQVLQSTGGSPAWVDSNTLSGTLTTVGTSGFLLQTTGGAAAWRGITGGAVLVGNTSGQPVEADHTATTAGGKLVTLSSVSAGWIDDDWSMTAVFDAGAGSTLSTGIMGVVMVPWDVGIEKNEVVANTTGDFVCDIYVEDLSSTPATSASKITASAPPTLTNAQRSSDATQTGWTTAIVAGDYIAFDLTLNATSGIRWAAVTLKGKKLSTV